MVFESIVADLLNRTLGDYVENLDYTQLKLGIWGGDVVLHNLVLKQTALEDLNLPIKIAFGNLGKLVLKIPWKNLYNSPVEARVQGLYLVLIPSQEAVYDAEKEEKWLQEGKQAVLLKVEEAKKKALERENEDQTVKVDTFVEKLIMQILKNVQVKVEDIHIRYEDRITTPGHPFALGLTLHNLSIQTTNNNWEETIILDVVDQFYKKLVLEGLGIYWNCDTHLYWTSGVGDSDIKLVCKEGIYTKEHMPKDFHYMLGPINSVVKLVMAPRPEALHYNTPKVFINWELENLSLGLSKSQYRDLIGVLESFDRMTRGLPYRKYRPNLPSYTGYARQWWKFAFTCVLEEDVRRVRQNWKWSRMQKHCARCRKYATAYQAKLTAKKVSAELQREVADLERHLDVLNIILVRQRVEAEVSLDKQRKATAVQETGWFGGWWGSSAKPAEDTLTASAIAKKFENAMTTEEKAKLYRAIDYEENASAAEYPDTFIEVSLNFELKMLGVEVRDEIYDIPRVMYMELMGVKCTVETRPAVQAIKVISKMAKLTVYGMQQGKYIPKLVISKELTGGTTALLNVLFETQPLDKTCDQRVHISSRPLEVIYDASTINKVIDVFKPPQQSRALNQLQAAATIRLKNLKELSAMGLQYAIDTHTVLDLNVDLMSSYILIPKRGMYTRSEDLLVINLGRISMKSVINAEEAVTVRDLHSDGHTEEAILQRMINQSYDNFVIQVHDMQILVAMVGENWKATLADGKASHMHLLTPTSLTVNLDRCVISNDPRFPLLKIAGHLPSVSIAVSDERLLRLVFLLTSIPLANEEEIEMPSNTDTSSHQTSVSIFSRYEIPLEILNIQDSKPWKKIGAHRPVAIISTDEFTIVQATEVDLRFELPDLSVTLYRLVSDADLGGTCTLKLPTPKGLSAVKIFSCSIMQLELSFVKQTFDQRVIMRLGGVAVDVHDDISDVRILDTPMAAGETMYLFTVIYNQVDKKSPEFRTLHKSIPQYVKVSFTTANVVLHQEALLGLMNFSQRFRAKLDNAVNKVSGYVNIKPHALTFIPEDGIDVAPKVSHVKKKRRAKKQECHTILFKFKANLEDLKVRIENRRAAVANITISGCSTEVLAKSTNTHIVARLKDVFVVDLDPSTEHPKVVSILGEEVLHTKILLYSDTSPVGSRKDPFPDVNVEADVSCIRVVYISAFVTSVMNFFDSFQTAKETLISAAAEAATAAKQNIQEAQLTRLKLNIKLQAPLFIIPVNPKSMDAIVLDFGKLSIDNTLRYVTVQDKKDAAVVDEIVIGLHRLKISRVSLTKDYQTMNECALLQPVSFQVDVTHNLSALWYTCLPDLNIEGTLESVHLLLTEEDVKMMMRIYTENFVQPFDPTLEHIHLPEWESAERVRLTSPGQMGGLGDGNVEDTHGVEHARLVSFGVKEVEEYKSIGLPKHLNPISLQYKFTMNYLYIDLFNGGIKVLDDESVLQENATRTSLARFSIHTLFTKGTIFVNSIMTMIVSLGNCVLEDTREVNSGKLTRLMQRKDNNPHKNSAEDLDYATADDTPYVVKADKPADPNAPEARNMMELTYAQNQNDVDLEVRVFSFDLILSLEYLTRLAEFASSGMAIGTEDTTSEAIPLAEVVSRTSKASRATKASKTSVKSKPSKRSNVSKSKSQATVKKPFYEPPIYAISVSLEKPDIILVESMEDVDTNCIIFNSELQLKLRLIGDRQVFSGSITHLQLFSCVYNPEKRYDTKALILHPCSIHVAGSTPNNEGIHLDVTLSSIKLGVSPGTIALLNKVYVTVFGSVAPPRPKGQSVEEEAEDLSLLWTQRAYNELDFWFLRPEIGTEAYVDPDDVPAKPRLPVNEICVLSAPHIIVTLEAGIGKQTLPMIMFELKIDGIAHNWSSQLEVESTIGMKMSYYNSRLALWEPLIEPIEKYRNNKKEVYPWELKLTALFTGEESPLDTSVVDAEMVEVVIPPAKINVCLQSEENLELTVTKTSLSVFTSLSEAFQSAVSSNWQTSSTFLAPYVVKNDTGMSIVIMLEDSPFQLYDIASAPYGKAIVRSGGTVNLSLSDTDNEDNYNVMTARRLSQSQDFQWENSSMFKERFLSIEMEPNNFGLRLPVARADKRYFSLRQRGEGQEPWGLVCDVQVVAGSVIVTLRGIIQVHNHFHVPIKVYYMTNRGNEVELIGTVKPDSELNLPLESIYTQTSEIFFGVSGYTVSVKPLVWKNLRNMLTITELLQCEPKDKNNTDTGPFFLNVVGETEQVYFEQTCRHTMVSTIYNIHLRPTVIVRNLLPIDMTVGIEGAAMPTYVLAGERLIIPNAEPGNTKLIYEIPDYLEKDWSCTHVIQTTPVPFSVVTFMSYTGMQRLTLDLGVHTEMENGTAIMSVYCPFWMVNKTEISLVYRTDETANILHHPGTYKGPILFSFKPKSFFGKKKASIKIADGEWSDKFSLDVAGSSGLVICKGSSFSYQIGVHITLTASTLSKTVTFTPYYVLINDTKVLIEVQEGDRPADPWTKVKPASCTPLWPMSGEKERDLRLRIAGTPDVSAHFSYSEAHTTLLKLDNRYGGVNVDVQVSEAAVYVTFTPYVPGFAPAAIINHTNEPLVFWEKGLENRRRTLHPRELTLFTWQQPKGARSLLWSAGKTKEIADELRKDGIGEFTSERGYSVYWVSFLDGMQRILLFTQDDNIAELAQSAGDLAQVDTEVVVSIHGLGLSLVNNDINAEVLYIGVASSGVAWEGRKDNTKRFKPLTIADSALIETAYQRYRSECDMEPAPTNKHGARYLLANNLEVDFDTEEMLKPVHRTIRRTFYMGMWILLKMSSHQLQLHAKINRLQIDNQLMDSMFPVMLAPVPPPRSVAAINLVNRPFAELSVVRRIMEHSHMEQYKYFKILIQEFHIKVDIGLINALVALFEAKEASEVEQAEHFRRDTLTLNEPLLAHVSMISSQEQSNFYDELHLSPLKIHLSFSLASATGGQKPKQETPAFLNVLLQSLGVTLTDVQDVVFKLAFFERKYCFLSQKQLVAKATSHYVSQAVKQLYVLVLGLDVLGNPYGLVLGLTQGVEDLFYEPFQGAIQGPGEFAEGLVLGVRSLFGHTVGGAAGAASRITGAMGKGIAALTFDKDYQRKRREALNQRPANVQMGLAQSGKGLVMGVVDGVSGVFTKPISGARQDGVAGFFTGMGKGVVGLVTRPTAGVIDFASGSLEAVKRATEMNEEVFRLRLPRFFHPDGLIRPYSAVDAEGNKLLQDVEKGRFIPTDIYSFHLALTDSGKDILLLTDKRVMYLAHNDMFGKSLSWSCTWDCMKILPKVDANGICITIPSDSKAKVLGLFSTGDSVRHVPIKNKELRVLVHSKMLQLMNI